MSQEKESKWYYYRKDRNGKEVCEFVPDVDKEIQNQLFDDGSHDGFMAEADLCVQTIHENDFAGYATIEQYVENEGSDEWIEAVKEGVDSGLSFPFVLVRHTDGTYEPMNESDVDWQELFAEYVDVGHYQIPPAFYCDSEFTEDMARQSKMWKLAKKLRGFNYVIRDKIEDSEEPDEYETLEEAQKDVAAFEAMDKKDGTYSAERYEIVKKPISEWDD